MDLRSGLRQPQNCTNGGSNRSCSRCFRRPAGNCRHVFSKNCRPGIAPGLVTPKPSTRNLTQFGQPMPRLVHRHPAHWVFSAVEADSATGFCDPLFPAEYRESIQSKRGCDCPFGCARIITGIAFRFKASNLLFVTNSFPRKRRVTYSAKSPASPTFDQVVTCLSHGLQWPYLVCNGSTTEHGIEVVPHDMHQSRKAPRSLRPLSSPRFSALSRLVNQ